MSALFTNFSTWRRLTDQSKRRKETKRKQVEAEFKKKAQKINERMAEIKEAHDAKV